MLPRKLVRRRVCGGATSLDRASVYDVQAVRRTGVPLLRHNSCYCSAAGGARELFPPHAENSAQGDGTAALHRQFSRLFGILGAALTGTRVAELGRVRERAWRTI